MGEETMHNCPCPKCAEREAEAKQADQTGTEILVALMPLLAITLFSNLGLF